MALGDGSAWDETVPVNGTLAVLIDDYDRDLRVGVRSRMAFEHEWPDSQAATAQGGKHKFITLQNQAAKPTVSGTQLAAIYTKTVGAGLQEMFFENEAGTEVQVTNRSSLVTLSTELALVTGVSNESITATTGAQLMIATFVCSARPLMINAYAPLRGGLNGYAFLSINIDGASVTGYVATPRTMDAGIAVFAQIFWATQLATGSHSVELFWKAGHPSYGIAQSGGEEPRILQVVQI